MYKIILLSGIMFWPLSLLRVNTLEDFIIYTIPAFLMGIALFLYIKKPKYYLLPIFVIPFVEPKLSILPLLFVIIISLTKRNKRQIFMIVIAILILLVNWKDFYGQTILVPDYQRRQEVLRNINLYDSVFMARFFQNKVKIVSDKFVSNFLELSDPNNYFFGFSPRQIVGNQNIVKFPYPLIPIFLFGLFNFRKIQHKNIIITFFTSSLLSLSILNIYDRQDFIIWIPLGLFFIEGLRQLNKKGVKFARFYYLITLFLIGLVYYQTYI